MSLSRDQLGVALLAATYVVLAAVCGVVFSTELYAPTSFGLWIVMCLQAAAISITVAEAVLLACWSAMSKDTVLGWGASLLTLTFMGYAFAFGCNFSSHTSAEDGLAAIRAAVLVALPFLVVYAFVMPMAAFWQWRLVASGTEAVQRSQRRLSLGQMFRWTFAVALPFGVSGLFVSGQADSTTVLGLFLGVPLLLSIVLSIGFAAFDPTRRLRRMARSVLWLFAMVMVELGVVAAVLIADQRRVGASYSFWRMVAPQLVMLTSLNITCFLVAMLSSLWLRRCGYSFVVTSKDLESQ